ncbi:MAG: NUDIX hydrolase [Verrucomicrobiota bacterium]
MLNTQRKTVFSTPWFQVLESVVMGDKIPHYAIQSPDFVVVIAITERDELLLVRQFRHAVNDITLELPAGHVEPGETPEQAARKELFEETGHLADKFELIANLSPSPARFMNRMWCYYAARTRKPPDALIEAELNCVLYTQGLESLVREPNFYSSGSWAALLAAVAHGKLKF